jgi:hypothetical protein
MRRSAGTGRGDRELGAAVADGDTGEYRDTQRLERVGHGVLHVVAAPVPGAEHDAGGTVEPTRLEELGEQPVDPVGRLAHVLEEHDPSLRRDRPRRGERRGEQRQVAAHPSRRRGGGCR